MVLTRGDMDKKIIEAANYLKKKVVEMENSENTGIGEGRQRAHIKLEELKGVFSYFEKDLKNRE
ncbi:hypothetical protein CL644_00390 [bacterium]|jgi:hypothetical protein|nr:hypothetical protein [Parcubacteria group bacterium]MBF05158.1 hypothetical protein [bacterium]|tara:strand:+ start:5518 stop:5709 length:192 start_codon:yes stop_codon:yes gene_type:complete